MGARGEPSADPAAGRRPEIGTATVVLLAAACGISVATLYYPQPILSTIARQLRTSSGTAGLVVTASQVGYALGLALLVPVGDVVNRRRLVPAVLAATAVTLTVAAASSSPSVLIALSVIAGVGAVVAQVLVPLAASLASDDRRGRVVGTVMTGLLLGILLARTVSGLVAGVAGWRAVYVMGAVLVAALAVVLARALPADEHKPDLAYGALLRSIVTIFLAEPLLRRRALFGALGFAAFSVFWTTSAFLLAGAPYRYGDAVIGLFGLAGAAGALCAQAAGRLADRGLHRQATIAFAALTAASFVPTLAGRHSLAALIAGIIVLDMGVQGLQVTNQSLIYRLNPEARSRVNSAYMVCYFAGGAVGSAVAATAYGSGGWAAVCALGGALGAVATALALFDAVRPVVPTGAR